MCFNWAKNFYERFIGDSLGYYICHKYNESSVIDFKLTSESFLNNVLYLHAHKLTGNLNDHCTLSVMLRKKSLYQIKICVCSVYLRSVLEIHKVQTVLWILYTVGILCSKLINF